MKYQELIVLLPCHSLEDFPTHHDGEEADGLLAAWTGLWHPALLASVQKMPQWYRVDDPPAELEQRLVVIPSVSQSQLPTGFVQRAKAAGARVVRRQSDRELLIAEALAELDGGDAGVPTELAADFLALGYCHLQVELLTRQMRYSSNLDEIHFQNEVVAAAQAAVEGNETLAHDKLAACFDLLAEERDHYYSVDAFVLDLLLVTPGTIGAALRDELQETTPRNILLPAEALRRMATDEPDVLQSLREALDAGRLGLIGGEAVEQRNPLLAAESVLANLRRGLALYQQHLGRAPKTFGRWRAGLTPLLPQLLTRLGFQAAMHATLEDGKVPEGGQVKTRWEGLGGAVIDSLARSPLNASQAATFLGYAGKLGESMDSDHVATLFLAHWPGRARPWLADLRRISQFTSALGKPVTCDEYFRETDLAGHLDRFEADQYRTPYLKQSVVRREEDPISTSVRYWQRRAAADAAQSLDTLAVLLGGRTDQTVPGLVDEVDQFSELADLPENGDAPDLDQKLAAAVESATQRVADRLPREQADPRPGYLLCNPFSFVRRVALETPALGELPNVERPVYAATVSGQSQQVVVDVPPMGFVWLQAGSAASQPKRKEEPVLTEDTMLRNEFFEVLINPQTGAIQSLLEYRNRGNRLSQQLAFRGAGETGRGTGNAYTRMVAERVEVTSSSPVFGEILAEGRLVDRQQQTIAEFQQRYQLWRGSRVLRVEIELKPRQEPKADPWNSYYGCRFAWADEAAALWRTVNQTRQPVESRRFEAPNYVEIDDSNGRTAILTGGLPYHRRHGDRMLDTLLITRGERQRRFVIGIGVDLPQPGQEAMNLLLPAPRLQQTAAPPRPQISGWLFHVDSRGVLATHWQPLLEEGRPVGVRVRLLETAGRAARCRLRCLRPVESACQRDFQGNTLGGLRTEGDAIQMELAANEWLEIEARWKS